MPLSPHREVTDEQIEACRRLGYPPPPIGSQQVRVGVFTYRDPGERPPPDALVSLRWRFEEGRLINFVAYGWRAVPQPRGRRRNKPKLEYGILPADVRYEEAMKLLEDREA